MRKCPCPPPNACSLAWRRDDTTSTGRRQCSAPRRRRGSRRKPEEGRRYAMDTTQAPLDPMAERDGGTNERWPALPWDAWNDTCETLHMWMQIVGKVALALAPFLNEWWQVAFHLTARGLTTGPLPFRDGIFEMEFDFVDHQLVVRTSDGRRTALALKPRSVADFYLRLMRAPGALCIEFHIRPLPVEVPGAIPFDADQVHAAYDPAYAHRWWS